MLNSFFHPLICLLVLITPVSVRSQTFRILQFSETTGYDHQTRIACYNMFQQMGTQINFIADHDSTGDAFNSLVNLQQYTAIVFANTTGNNLLDSIQRGNFEQYISNGGHVIAIHSATDTYRHSSANGSNTGAWDFYPELLGASVQYNPTHVSGTPVFPIHTTQPGILLTGIPDPWFKAEEYYYWEFGYFDSLNNSVLLMVDTTIGPNSLVNSYDLPRATTWYKITTGGNKIFYTSLGHDVSNYTSDTLFFRLILNAVLWVSDITSTQELSGLGTGFLCYPNPVETSLNIEPVNGSAIYSVSISDACGKAWFTKQTFTGRALIDTRHLPGGIYLLFIESDDKIVVRKFCVF